MLDIWPSIWQGLDQERVDAAVAEQLTAAGILDDGRIHPVVEEWLRALHRPDVELAVRIWDPSPEPDLEAMLRMSLVRAGSGHVLAVRHGDHVIVQSVHSDGRRVDPLAAALLTALGPCPALVFDPLRAGQAQLLEVPEETAGRRQALLELGATPRSAGLLSRVLSEVERQAEVMVVEHHDGAVTPSPEDLAAAPPLCVQVLDTASGRIVVSPSVAVDGEIWVNYLPGDDAAVHAGIRALVDLLPGGSWFGTSRV